MHIIAVRAFSPSEGRNIRVSFESLHDPVVKMNPFGNWMRKKVLNMKGSSKRSYWF